MFGDDKSLLESDPFVEAKEVAAGLHKEPSPHKGPVIKLQVSSRVPVILIRLATFFVFSHLVSCQYG